MWMLANEIASSVEEHARFGGVVPEVASRAHLEAMVPTLRRVVGDGLQLVPKVTGAEDFSFFQRVVPGLFFFLGVTEPGRDPRTAAPAPSSGPSGPP